ncbi:hypothetical protein HMI54_002169 [Coelomomyces lativittatus]|nr:hypothetical protein HMI56_004841 [Coelomomyces lativittatus]KAJ1514327.1 hypothetical protein HMI55_004759 [Coelomomyces lativittatus]KAJ1518180.1 hypothetical protein HMI54_002169 [Coelomomyces lativittatus]
MNRDVDLMYVDTTTLNPTKTKKKPISTLKYQGELDKEDLSINDLTERAANLQTFNMEFVKKLELLKNDYQGLMVCLQKEEMKKSQLEHTLHQLQTQLKSSVQQIQHFTELSKKIKIMIQETETSYHQILTSSESLLKGLCTQSQSIKEAMNHYQDIHKDEEE